MNNTGVNQKINTLFVVVVVYGVSPEDCPALQTLSREALALGTTVDVMIYDNSPAPIPQEAIRALSGLNCNYIGDTSNSGVSRAYNSALETARRDGKEWLLLLDQDTTLPEGALAAYLDSIAAHPETMIHAPSLRSGEVSFSPSKVSGGYPRAAKSFPVGEPVSLKKCHPINSGSCISVEFMSRIGGYLESLPLDFSDHEFMARAARAGGEVVYMPLVLPHDLSPTEPDVSKKKVRYAYYCRGAFEYSRATSHKLILLYVATRSIYLSIKHKDVDFAKMFFSSAKSNYATGLLRE